MLCSQDVTPMIQKVIKFRNFSCMARLTRVVALCRRFISNCRKKKTERNFDELNAEECEHARNMCIRSVQMELSSESGFEKRAESLGLYEGEDGFVRCRGRIGKAKKNYLR